MAWPCISRVCCLSRFWNQLDKSDLSVPLTVQNYSEIIEQEVRSVAQRVPADSPANSSPAPASGPRAGEPPVQESVSKHDFKSWKVRKEASCKPRQEYQPSGAPFSSETQYQLDFKPWPIPRKADYPWIRGGPASHSSGAHTLLSGTHGDQQRQAERQESPIQPVSRHTREEDIRPAVKTTSYRQEFQPWTGVKVVKPVKIRHVYTPPEDRIILESSYRAAFTEDSFRRVEPFQVSSSKTQNQIASVAETGNLTKTENSEPVVKTKLSPSSNSSAVFQTRSRVLNI